MLTADAAPDAAHRPNRQTSMIRLAVQQPSLAKYRIPVFRELASRPGIDLTVHYADTPGIPNVEPDGFRAVHTPMQRAGLAGNQAYFHRPQVSLARRERCDVLLMGWDLHYASLVPGLLRARRNRVGTVLWGHGYSKHERPLRRSLRDKVGRMADAVLFYNHAAERAAIEAGFDAERVFVALNSLDQSPIQAARARWLADPGRLAAFRHDEGLDGPLILFVSRLDPDNRVDLLLRAAVRLRGRWPTLRVVIVGKGPHGPELERLADELNIRDNVRFQGAIYEEDRLAPWFCAADVFCYPANIGLSILHAFGYGLPVITGDRLQAQNPEIEALRDGENGLLFADGNERALAAALERLIEDDVLRGRLSAEAHRTATEVFTIERMVDGIVAAAEFAAARAGSR